MISNVIKKQFEIMEERGWEEIYWAIDFHNTIIPASYSNDDGNSPFYSYAIEALKILTEREDCRLILWTSSHRSYIEKHLERMKNLGVDFDYFNENPVCKSTELCDFDSKFYFNVLIDDKAGFNGESDWSDVLHALSLVKNKKEEKQ